MAINQLNLPQIYGAAEQVKGMQTQNALARQSMEQRQQFQGLAPKIAAGDQAATQQGLALAPQDTAAIMQARAQMSEAEAAKLRAGYEEVARAAEWAKTPEQWDRAIDFLGPEFEPYRGQFPNRELIINRVREVSDILGGGKPMSGPGKVQYDIDQGILPAGTPLRSAGVTVNLPGQPKIGSIPPGYQARQDEKTGAWTMEQIPGGPPAQEAAGAAAAAEEKSRQKITQADIVAQDIDRAIALAEGAKVPVTGMGSFLSAIPGTAARDLDAMLNTIKANVGFSKLQAMREASPTGGALGQVSENENRLLQSVLGSLEQSQSQENFLYNMRRLRDTYLDIIHGPGNRPGAAAPAGQPTAAPQIQEGAKAVNPKTGERIIFRNGRWVPLQ